MKIIALEIIQNLRTFFYSGKTLPYQHRKNCLQQFQKLLDNHQDEMITALEADFKKPQFETLVTEIAMLQKELNYFKRNLKSWVKPKQVAPTLLNFPSQDYIVHQPYGVVLIIAPWNYPLLLALQPLLAALVAGNCVVLKPSELSNATSELLSKILPKYFSPQLVQVVQGDSNVATTLLEHKFDKIFFTGSTAVGKIIYKAAAEKLTPVVLELGGKSPCVVLPNANLKLAAKRIVYGKFVNAGQTCIAPDFVFIHPSIETVFVNEIAKVLKEFYGDEPEKSDSFARIINDKHYQRIKQYILNGKVLIGGQTNSKTRFIAPTVLKVTDFNDEVMQNELFGPVLPIVNYHHLSDIISYNHQNPKPLAFYVFGTSDTEIQKLLKKCQFGGACVNDCLVHIVNSKLPFGGFGASGIGNYHGKFGFAAFSHQQAIMYRKNWFDNPLKYPPYKKSKINLVKKLFKFF